MLPRHLNAQQPSTPIIGVLDSATATNLKLSTFYEGLKVEGFSRNQNLAVEYHSAEGDYARLPELAADLVNRRVTLITALGTPAAQAAKAATTTIPIVFAVGANPTETGLVTNLSHPGANMTGVTGMAVGREQKGWSYCARRFQLQLSLNFCLILRIRISPHKSIMYLRRLRNLACR
jgi:putative ABC transport system substrate-binding protein